MNPIPVAKPGRPLTLVFLAALILAWAGGSSAVADDPAPSPASDFQTLLLSTDDCALPPSASTTLPALLPASQWEDEEVPTCSPFCGYTGCRGVPVGSLCTKSTGGQGTCYGPPLGRQCADLKPMCLCV